LNSINGFFRYLVYLSGIVNWRRLFQKPGFACSNAAIGTMVRTNSAHGFTRWEESDIATWKEKSVSLDGLMDDEDRAPLEPADTRPMHGSCAAARAGRAHRRGSGEHPAEYREAVCCVFRKD